MGEIGRKVISDVRKMYQSEEFKISEILQSALAVQIDSAVESALKQQRLEIAHTVANAESLKDCAFEILLDS